MRGVLRISGHISDSIPSPKQPRWSLLFLPRVLLVSAHHQLPSFLRCNATEQHQRSSVGVCALLVRAAPWFYVLCAREHACACVCVCVGIYKSEVDLRYCFSGAIHPPCCLKQGSLWLSLLIWPAHWPEKPLGFTCLSSPARMTSECRCVCLFHVGTEEQLRFSCLRGSPLSSKPSSQLLFFSSVSFVFRVGVGLVYLAIAV